MTHKELIQRGERWLRNTMGCRVVLCEMVANTVWGEVPDIIGFRMRETILVECKTSVADFKRDLEKPFRGDDDDALGDWRFYLTPPGLLAGQEVPYKWGVYEVQDKQIRHAKGVRHMTGIGTPYVSCWRSERALLLSALARRGAAR